MATSNRAEMFDDWSFEKKTDAFIAFWGRSPLVNAVSVTRNPEHLLYIPKSLSIAAEMRMVEDAVRAGICEQKPYTKMTVAGWRLACRMAS